MAPKRKKDLPPVCSKKVKMSVADPRFDFEPKCIDWTSKSANQPLTQTQMIVLEPSPPLDSNQTHLLQPVTFDLPNNDQIMLPGNGTRLYVEGIFEKQETDSNEWSPIPNTEASEVIVSPNWFEKIIEKCEIRSKGGATSTLNFASQWVMPYLNEMFYAHMDQDLKKYLCMEPAHPGNATTLTRSKWDFEGDDWAKYHPSIFNGDKFKFSYIPFTWPFFQNPEFILNPQYAPKAVDLSLFESGQISITWNDYAVKHIFKKKNENSTTKYRVRITSLKMVLEIGNPTQKYQFPRKNIYYNGTTTMTQQLTLHYKTAVIKFGNIQLPNSIMLAFLPDNPEFFDYQTQAENAGFSMHPLRSIVVNYKDQELYTMKPDEINGHLGVNNATDLQNHLEYPIAGIPIDKKNTTIEQLKDDGKKYAFPHAYIRLSPGYHQRLLSPKGKLDQLQQPGNLDIELRFTETEPVNKKLMIVAFAFYDDYYNVAADVKNKRFYNPMFAKE
jgi:hypothetical protein